VLCEALEAQPPREPENLQWVCEQLHFCVILTLNNAYYQVREAETQAFYDQFRIELEARNLDELLDRFLTSLVQLCRADAACLYFLDPQAANWAPKAGSCDAKRGLPDRPGLQRDFPSRCTWTSGAAPRSET